MSTDRFLMHMTKYEFDITLLFRASRWAFYPTSGARRPPTWGKTPTQ